MSQFIVTSAKDTLVWLVLLISGAASFDMPAQECRKYLDIHLANATNEELVMILKPDDATVQKLVARLADDKYEVRLRAEQILTAMGHHALPFFETVRDASDNPNARFVLERIINNVGKDSFIRDRKIMVMFALRLLDPKSPEYDVVLTDHLSSKDYAIERLALDELMRTRKAAAAPIVLAYMKKASPKFSTLRPSRMAAIYSWLGDEALSGKDSDAIRVALLRAINSAQGPAAPALVEALNHRTTRKEVLAALAKILARDPKANEVVGRFAAEISGKEIAAESLSEWLRSSEKTASSTSNAKWDKALATLVESWHVAVKAAERAEVEYSNAPDTSFTACLDIEQLSTTDARKQWIGELFGASNYTLRTRIIKFLTLDGGLEFNRIYLSASDKTKIDLDFFAGMIAGNIDIDRLRKMVYNGCILMTLKGEFDAKALRASLEQHLGMCLLTHKQHRIFIAPCMSICVLDDSTLLIGLGQSLPGLLEEIRNAQYTPGAVHSSAYQKANGTKALFEALDRIGAENRLAPKVRFSEEGGIFRATLHKVEGLLAVPFAIKRIQVRLREDKELHVGLKFECADEKQAQALSAACKTLVKLFGAGKFAVKDKGAVIFNDILRDARIMQAGDIVTAAVKIPAKVCDGVIRFFSDNSVEKYTSDQKEDSKKNSQRTTPIRPKQLPGRGPKKPPVKQVPGGN